MGIEVQSKMYIPGYYSLRDQNSNAGNGSGWSIHQQRNVFGEYRDFFSSRPVVDVNERNEKERLRQTILKHECLFRHQLYELHRVYRIQREMMNEVCREERSNVIQAGGFGSSICSSQLLLNDDKARSNVSNSHDMELNYGRLSMSSSVKENTVQSGYYVSGNGLGFKDCEPLESSGSKRPRRRLFDLELPGDAYNDGEVGSGVSGDTRSLFSCTKTMNGSHSLNEPVKMKELSSSASVEVFGDFFCSKDEMGRRVQSSNSHSDFPCLASRFSQESHKGNYGGLLVRNNIEAGRTGSKGNSFCGSYSPENLLKPSKSQQIEPGSLNVHASLLSSDKIKTESCVKKKLFGVELCEGGPPASIEAQFQQPVIPQSITVKSESSSHKNLYSVVSPNISFSSYTHSNRSSIVHSPEVVEGRLKDLGSSRYVLRPEASTQNHICLEAKESWVGSSQLNAFGHLNGISDSSSMSAQRVPRNEYKDLNFILNSKSEVSGNDTGKHDSQGGLSWLKAMASSKRSSESFVQDSSSATRALDAEQWRIEAGECSSNRKILGFPISDKQQPLISHHSAAADEAADCVIVSEVQEQHKVEGPRNQIDLNLCLEEDEVEEKPQSSLSSSKTNSKVVFEIDLEAPPINIEDTDITPEAESVQNQLEELVKVAAEALVTISSSNTHQTALHQPEPPPTETLQWFAEIITSYKEVTIQPTEHQLDYFELMTLNLTETELETYHYTPQEIPLSPKIDDQSTKRPRRGQARRRKDFQRDVLPSVASLSKTEVTDDLQTIEGLIRATGGSWQSSLALKNAGRGKGRRRSSPGTCTPKCSREAAAEEVNLIRWGKRTRRPPRQRCSVSNPVLVIK